MSNSSDRYLMNSVLRTTQILESFSIEKPSYTNSELATKLGLNKSTMTRLLASLEKADFLERDPASGRYSLTVKLFSIGRVYISQINFHKEAAPYLAELASLWKETVHLAVPHNHEVFYLDKVESFGSIGTSGLVSTSGMSLPAYCTAIGKVFLAYLEEEELEKYFQAVELKAHTPRTITDPDKLKEHLKIFRSQGYSVEDRERGPEIKSIAAPVFNHEGKVVAGISIAGPEFRIGNAETAKKIAASVKETAATISRRIGYLN